MHRAARRPTVNANPLRMAAAIMIAVHPPRGQRKEARPDPTAPKMKLLVTNAVLRRLRAWRSIWNMRDWTVMACAWIATSRTMIATTIATTDICPSPAMSKAIRTSA